MHVSVGVILEGRCAHVGCTVVERRSVVPHQLKSLPKPTTDGALECCHVVAIFSCRLEFKPQGGVQLFVILHDPLLYVLLLYGTFLGWQIAARCL